MENWFILNKLIILIYISERILDSSLNYPENMLGVILFSLLFIVLNMSKAIVQTRRYKLFFLSLSVFELLLCCFFVNPTFIFLIPINVFESVSKKLHWGYILGLLIILVCFVDYSILGNYIIITLLNFLGFIFVLSGQIKIKRLSDENEKLQDKNNNLVINLDNQILYRDQIVYTSQLEERNKIAQEIHDKVGHSISASLMQLEAARLVMDKDNAKSKHLLGNAIDTLRNGMESIRSTLKNIKPNQEHLGINKIKLLVDEFKSNEQISVSLFQSANLENISFLQWKIIYENTIEAFTNIRKYSSARNIKVDINVLNKLIKIEIKDDGIGCNKIIKGLGISGIEERTLNLGGKLIMDGSNGFSVITLLPIEKKLL